MHTHFVVHSLVAYVRAVHDIIFIVESHDPILLVPYLIFRKIGAALALISTHHIVFISLGAHVRLRDVGVAMIILHSHLFVAVVSMPRLFSESVCLPLLAHLVLLVRGVVEPIRVLREMNILIL